MTGWLRKTFGADDAADAAIEAADISAAGQTEALDYLKEQNRIPSEVRDEALTGLGEYYQVPGEQLDQQGLIDQAMSSPLYKSIMDTRKFGEDALLRNRSATGGLRSGGSQKDIYDYNLDLNNRALLTSYNEAQERQDYERALHLQGLGGLSGIGGNENAIAQLTAGIGETRAAGVTAASQAKSAGTQNALNTILGIGQTAAMFSDIRLKDDIRFLTEMGGFNIYGWTWNELAAELGLEGECSGVMAHQVFETHPQAVSEKDGYMQVDYNQLGAH